jgi:hypothetical protein
MSSTVFGDLETEVGGALCRVFLIGVGSVGAGGADGTVCGTDGAGGVAAGGVAAG